MNEPREPRDLREPQVVSRRQFLSLLGLTSASAGALLAVPGEASAASKKVSKRAKVVSGKTLPVGPIPLDPPSSSGSTLSGSTGKAGQRTLVVIELQGGNDGFSMLIPSGDGRFRQLRDRVWLEPANMVRLDDRYSVAKGLAPLMGNLALVEGVGVAKPEFSHTEMMARWWQGDPDGNRSVRTGFLGRCCDLLGNTSGISGISVGGGFTPSLVSERSATVALPDVGSLRELTQDQDTRMRPSLSSLTEGGTDSAGLDSVDADLLAKARAGMASGLNLLNGLGGVTGKKNGYPDDSLSGSLSLVRELISLNQGIRILHIPWGSFDTHTNQRWSHPDQMNHLGAALGAFRGDLARAGLSDRVLVATVSEFGRRPAANAGGTDHGAASTALLMGPVRGGRHGSPLNFNQLDASGNVAATVSMNDYYATLASWLGLPISELMAGGGTPLASIGI